MSCRVVKVSTRSELKDFINLPFEIYRNDRNWVAPIKSELMKVLDVNKNPYFKFASLDLFNCYSGDKIVARISLSVNIDFCSKTGIKVGFFGFFESFNDSQAVKFLFKCSLNTAYKTTLNVLKDLLIRTFIQKLECYAPTSICLPLFFRLTTPNITIHF